MPCVAEVVPFLLVVSFWTRCRLDLQENDREIDGLCARRLGPDAEYRRCVAASGLGKDAEETDRLFVGRLGSDPVDGGNSEDSRFPRRIIVVRHLGDLALSVF